MKYFLIVMLFLGSANMLLGANGYPDEPMIEEYVEDAPETKNSNTLKPDSFVNISVVGQGIAPSFARSPAQSYVLAKRAAMADAYRLIAERIKGVRVQGKDTIKNMAIKSSVINTQVTAMIRDAEVTETTFKDGLCEVEMGIRIDYNSFK